MKKIVSILLVIVMSITIMPSLGTARADFVDITDPSVYLKQGRTKECTLISNVMMLRRRALLEGDPSWNEITRDPVAKVAWGPIGVFFEFPFNGKKVTAYSMGELGYKTPDLDGKKQYFIESLNEHPEGIVIYFSRKDRNGDLKRHAVLLTDYDGPTDTFYCADPASKADGRIPLADSTLPGTIKMVYPNTGLTNQDFVIAYITQIWIITDGSGSLMPEYVKNQCTQYPTSVKLSVVVAGSMMSLPCEGRTYGESVAVTPLGIGSTYTADSLVVNSAGNCWYAVRYNGKTGYIYCGDVTLQPPSGESISFSDIALPVNVRTGKGFGLRGELSSSDVKIKSLVCSVYPNSDLSGTPVLQHIQNVNGYSLSVKNSDLNTKMKFGSLPAGDYTLTYDVYTEDYYAANNSVAQYSNHYTIAAKSFSVSDAGKDRITVSATAAEPYIDLVAEPYIDLADTPASAPAPEPTATPAPSVEEPAQNPAQKPSISVSGNNTPGSLQQGRNFGIRGTVYTDCGMITELYGAIYDSNGNAVQTSRHSPNASSVNLRYTINNDLVFGNLGAGSYTYYVEATAVNGGETATNTVIYDSFNVYSNEPEQTPTEPPQQPVQNPAQKPSISVSGNNTPGSLQQGRNFGIRGTVYTDCGMITELYGAIYDSNGNAVQTSRHSPNASSVNLRYTINNDLVFGNLGAGSYTYYVEATAVNGGETATNTVIYDSFNVYSNEPEQTPTEPPQQPVQNPAQKPSISVSGNNTPGSLQQGGNFGIRGTVYTDCGMITELYGAIYDSTNGNAVQTSRHSPNASSVDLRYTINNDLVFGNLGAGSYTYYVEAAAVNGGETTTSVVISDSFNVYSNQPSLPQTEAPSVDEPELDSVDCYMTVNVGADSTLRFCSTVSVADQYELGSICNDVSVYVYGTTKQQYEDRTWAKINYNGRDGWVNYKWLAPQADAPASSYSDVPYPIDAKECWMTVNVGQGSTLSFRSDVYVEESTKICTLRDGTSIYVYGTTTQQYNGITWARVNYNNQDGWVDYKWLA